ncbi:MAG: hypothetical protein J1E43_04910 [Christensenellaceae bacterium]|nr:hypothetical protein [Christensenellaceae bacterium]
MALLKTFATLALISGALLVLLPDGSLRRTAALVMGLLLTLCWAEGLISLISLPQGGALPDTALAPTGTTVQQIADELLPEVTQSP